ncbi:hypothetical protein TrRE_jg4775 [Triparma retinervis]|uniref:Peptidase M50 domain-containing protein n=1 Tax=Triparma retinervis TaxID=2557542 RepID=A0A9W7G224_9STRA|nr:hypothetical protein TrRE_jg4775 [Triparma retinervis]
MTVVSQSDVQGALLFMSIVSVNLAFVNSLPLPSLDGGQIAFVLAEVVGRKKIQQRTVEEINAYALLLLLALTGWTSAGDIKNLIVK